MHSVKGHPQAAYSLTHASQTIQWVNLTLLRQIYTSWMVIFHATQPQ
jgi:hypothetical protein